MTDGETTGAGSPPTDPEERVCVCVHICMHTYIHKAAHTGISKHIYVSEYVYVQTHTLPPPDLHPAQPQRGQDAAAASTLLGYQIWRPLNPNIIKLKLSNWFFLVNTFFLEDIRITSYLLSLLNHSKVTGLYTDFCFAKMHYGEAICFNATVLFKTQVTILHVSLEHVPSTAASSSPQTHTVYEQRTYESLYPAPKFNNFFCSLGKAV